MHLQVFIDRLEQLSQSWGVPVSRRSLGRAVTGCSDSTFISVCTGLNKEQQLITLIHELTHVLVHCSATPAINRTVCEYEAQAVEQLVAAQLGLAGYRSQARDLASVTDDLLACSVTRVKFAAVTLLGAARSAPDTPVVRVPIISEGRRLGPHSVR